jgi:hypothetical protein
VGVPGPVLFSGPVPFCSRVSVCLRTPGSTSRQGTPGRDVLPVVRKQTEPREQNGTGTENSTGTGTRTRTRTGTGRAPDARRLAGPPRASRPAGLLHPRYTKP